MTLPDRLLPHSPLARRATSRRAFLSSLGALGLGPALLRSAPAAAEPGVSLIEPSQLRSRGGVLAATITAAPGRVQLGNYAFRGMLYNGSYLPPLLRAGVGETMQIRFENALSDQPSNLHYHGLAVSPRGNSDNVFIHVAPGRQFNYVVRLPAGDRQGPGLFWYHPHAHGVVAPQILGGMSGAIVIDGAEQFYPILKDLPERFFLLKHAEPGEGSEIISINGQLNPVVAIRPGEVQFWRIANIGATLFIKLHMAGVRLYTIATDGHFLGRPVEASMFFLGPGQRVDAIAVGPPAGDYPIATISFQNEAWRKPDPAQQLATIRSSGAAPAAQISAAEILAQRVQGRRWIDEVRSSPIAHRRVLNYSRTADRKVFMINGRVIDENRVDERVRLGDTEEWTIVNTDEQYHSFHIHQTAFLVTEINGVRQNEDSLRDTFSTPPATAAGPGILKVVIPFTDPVILGRFVYHCHAVDHEDKGMMGVIEVTD